MALFSIWSLPVGLADLFGDVKRIAHSGQQRGPYSLWKHPQYPAYEFKFIRMRQTLEVVGKFSIVAKTK